jgi:hypothetical protein
MLSLLLWCVFGLFWLKASGVAALHSNDSHGATSSGAYEAYQYFPPYWIELALAIVAGSLMLGILLLGSVKFAHFFFDLGARFAPGKMKAKLAKFGASWAEMHEYFWSSKVRLAKVTLTSVFIWFLHLLQIWLFILALRAWVPFLTNLALSPLAILAGLLPVPTFGGAGTRDGALVALYAPYFATPVALALGLLCTARYILPAIGGLPFAGQYLAAVKTMKKEDLAGETAG